ncbi:non-ribosomal peptide synthetase [uncultured Roseobacter sp.]|uniref:non-ribosomal peptide synthetase n=1 Tax=uncultured Roseobacter sp. TaxID=114847 RepID=UPI0026207E2F|nr:non-ribosomal peptide synthetase [uncultured Roseobacter sp.]
MTGDCSSGRFLADKAKDFLRLWEIPNEVLVMADAWSKAEVLGLEVTLGQGGGAADLALSVPVPESRTASVQTEAYEYDQAGDGRVRSRHFIALSDGVTPVSARQFLESTLPQLDLPTWPLRPGVLPAELSIEHFGYDLACPERGMRICVHGDAFPHMKRVFTALGHEDCPWERDTPYPQVHQLSRWGQLRFLNLDIAQSVLMPRLGAECHFDIGQGRLESFLHWLHARGLCSADEREALLAWNGHQRLAEDKILLFRVTHLKFQYGAKPSIKAYLGCFPLSRGDHLQDRLPRLRPRARQSGWHPNAMAVEAPAPSENEGWLLEDFLRHAATTPDRQAVISDSRVLSYGDLLQLGTSLAQILTAENVRDGALVGVCLPRGWRQAVAVVGILLARAAYLPLDPAWPKARLDEICREAGCSLVITDRELDTSARSLLIDFDSLPNAERAHDPKVSGNHLAYVIYTSGSSGRPKGVAIDHHAALNTIRDVNEKIALTPDDRLLAVSSLTFDLSVYDLFGAWSAGASVVLLDSAHTADGIPYADALWRQCRDHRVTVWNSVPSLFRLLLAGLKSRPLPDTLRSVLLSGDWIPVDLPLAAWRLRPKLDILSLGGATEASIWSIMHPIRPEDCEKSSIPYGKPESMRGQWLSIVQPDLSLCAPGEVGELVIAGRGLARCYWNAPDLTAQSFVHHAELGRVYRTGDLGRLGGDGRIVFLGRKDQQVKVSGFRVDLSEIESKISQLDAVEEAAVVVCRGRPYGPIIVAWVVTTLAEADVRTHLEEILPASAIPRHINRLPALPRSGQQKVDRAKLAAWTPASAASVPVDDATTDLEQRIVNVWKRMLELDSIESDTHFFHSGGASFAALEVMLEVEEILQTELLPSLIYEFPVFGDFMDQLKIKDGKLGEFCSAALTVRNPTQRDVSAFLRLERLAPNELHLTAAQIRKQWEIFPEGQWIVSREAKILASLSGFRREKGKPGQASWAALTLNGTFASHEPNGECYYVADLKTDPDWLGAPLLPLLWDGFVDYLVRHPEISEIRAAVMLEGYRGDISPRSLHRYLKGLQHGMVKAPLLQAYLSLGAEPCDLIANYEPEAPVHRTFLNLRFDRSKLIRCKMQPEPRSTAEVSRPVT